MFMLMPIDCLTIPGSIQVRMLQRHLELHGVTSWMHPGPVEKKKYMKEKLSVHQLEPTLTQFTARDVLEIT